MYTNNRELIGSLLEIQPNQKASNFQFAYTHLEPEIINFVQQYTNEIKGLMHRSAQDIIEIGQRLIEVKHCLGHGNFTNWLKVEFNWSISTATKFMHVAEQLKFVNFTNLNIGASALYIIAAPSTSKDARAEVLKRAAMGENISYTQAKQIVSKYKKNTKSQLGKLESIDSDTTTTKPNSHNYVKIAEDETFSILSTQDNLIGKNIDLQTTLQPLEYPSLIRDYEDIQIVNFDKQAVQNTIVRVNNVRNQDPSSDDKQVNSLITEVAINLKNLTPEQLALVIEKSVEIGLSDRQLQVLLETSQKALETSN